jgi:hypothetical protein
MLCRMSPEGRIDLGHSLGRQPSFSLWMAGGGVKGGVVPARPTSSPYNIVKDPAHPDFQATLLHLFGIDPSGSPTTSRAFRPS